MDPFTISAGLVALLAPVLGRIGAAAVDRAADRAGQALGDGAARLWGRLAPRLAERPDAVRAIEELRADPDRERARRVLAGRVAMLLDGDPDLLREAAAVLASGPSQVRVDVRGTGHVVQTGDGNVAVSGSSGVTIHGGRRT